MAKKIKLSDIKPGPIRHQTLPAALLERIRAFKRILADADPTSLDQAIANFKRDVDPEREVEIWERIAQTYQHFVTRHAVTAYAKRRAIFTTLLTISLGAEPTANDALTAAQTDELARQFRNPAAHNS